MTDVDPEPSQLLQYLATYRVVICTECKYAVQPHAIQRHLKDIHYIHRGRRRPFTKYVATLRLDDPEDVMKATVLEFPVPLLPVHDGLRCQSDACGHLCVSEKRMKSHWMEAHGRGGEVRWDWKPTPLQTFFRGNLLKYFTREEHWPKSVCRQRVDIDCACPTPHLGASDACLLDHFISKTSISIAHDLPSEKLWQVIVPELAYQHPFLMHAVLACSALHLAHKNPAKQGDYLVQASCHQDVGTPLFRYALENVNEENCHAIMAFSHLLVIYAFALEKQDERLLLTEAAGTNFLPSWLHFLRNGCSMVCSMWDKIETGPVKELAEQWEIPIQVAQTDVQPVFDYLLSVIPSPYSPDVWSEQVCQLYTETADSLARAFACTRSMNERFTTWDALRIWPMLISVDYMRLLNNRHPGALILLAHYCILLQKVEEHWYFDGRAAKMLSAILENLDQQWMPFIEWPLKEIKIKH